MNPKGILLAGGCGTRLHAYRSGWIDGAQLERLATRVAKDGYGACVLSLLREGR